MWWRYVILETFWPTMWGSLHFFGSHVYADNWTFSSLAYVSEFPLPLNLLIFSFKFKAILARQSIGIGKQVTEFSPQYVLSHSLIHNKAYLSRSCRDLYWTFIIPRMPESPHLKPRARTWTIIIRIMKRPVFWRRPHELTWIPISNPLITLPYQSFAFCWAIYHKLPIHRQTIKPRHELNTMDINAFWNVYLRFIM